MDPDVDRPGRFIYCDFDAGHYIRGNAERPAHHPVGDYSSLMAEIHQMQNAQGAKLITVSSKPSDGLVLHTIDVASGFDDAQLRQFEKFAPYIVEVELGHTAVSGRLL